MSAGHKKGSSARASSRQTNNSNSRKAQDETPPTDLTKVGYVVCPVEKRSSLLFTFLKKNQNNKVVVLFNSTTSAKYHSELFGYLGLETTFIDINEKRLKVAKQFRCAAFTVLCRYDLIGKYEEATVLDRCVLYEPVNILPKIPDNSLVVLQPYETGFLDHLKRLFPVETEELKFAWTKIADVQPQIEKLVSETYSLNTAAREAFKDYLRGYNDLEPKGLFNVKNIELKKLCLSFGLKIPVAVDLTDADKNVSERRVKRKGSEGYAYYVANVKGSGKSEYRQIEEAKKMKIYKPIKNKRRRLKCNGMDSEQHVYNILLVGETGVGKSTFINAFMNYINFPTLLDALHADKVHALIPSKFTITDADFNTRLITFGKDKNESFELGASSTQSCRSYKFTTGDVAVRLIDSPGVGDTRGIRKDDDNFLHLLRYLGEFEYINAIVILLKPNDSKVTVLFEYCIKQLLASLERSAVENIIFLFTNARSTFYSPGDTVSPLKKILKDIAERPPNVAVPFTKWNTFCVDNEAFRFLVAKREGYCFNEKAQMSFIESWNISADVCQNLLMYVKSLKAHQIQNTVSLMDARRSIERLRVPLAEIAQLIKDNIRRNERLEEKLSDNTKRLEDLLPYLYVSRINLTVNRLDYPMTVCGSTSCTKAHKIEDSTKVHYEMICHEHCNLDGIPKEVRGDPGLQGCLAMMSKNGTKVCRKCGHSYLEHLHVYYTTTPYNETHKDAKVDGDINQKKLEKADIEKALQEYRVEKKKYEAEQDVIQKAVAQFAHFLKNSAILAYNDVYKKYIEYLIEREKSVGDLAKAHVIRDFEKMIEMYEQEQRTLDEALAKAQQADGTIKTVVTADDIAATIKRLYDLPLTGNTIKEMYDAQGKHAASETVKSTEQVIEPITDKLKDERSRFRKWLNI